MDYRPCPELCGGYAAMRIPTATAAGRWATSAPTATVPSNGDPYRDSMAELCSHLATERAGMETLRLRMRAPAPHPTGDPRHVLDTAPGEGDTSGPPTTPTRETLSVR